MNEKRFEKVVVYPEKEITAVGSYLIVIYFFAIISLLFGDYSSRLVTLVGVIGGSLAMFILDYFISREVYWGEIK